MKFPLHLAILLMFFATSIVALAQGVSAVLEPVEVIELRPVISGRLISVLADEGEAVEKGQPLARIDAGQQEQRVALARLVAGADGQLQRANAQVAQAETLQRRVVRARARNAAQAWEVEQARQALMLAQADRQIALDAQAQAKARLELELAVIADFTLRAPFDGTVLQRDFDVGSSVDPQSKVVTVGRLDFLEATAFVPIDWLLDLEVGQSLGATVEGITSVDAKVTIVAIDPRIDPASRTVRVKLHLDNSDGKYQPGATLIVDAP